VQSLTQALLDTLFQLDLDRLQALPIVKYVRVTYGVVVLTKLSLSAMATDSPLGQLLAVEKIQAVEYQDEGPGPSQARPEQIGIELRVSSS